MRIIRIISTILFILVILPCLAISQIVETSLASPYRIYRNHKVGIMDSVGKTLIEPDYDQIIQVRSQNWLLLIKENSYKLFHLPTLSMAPGVYDRVYFSPNPLARNQNGTWSILSSPTQIRSLGNVPYAKNDLEAVITWIEGSIKYFQYFPNLPHQPHNDAQWFPAQINASPEWDEAFLLDSAGNQVAGPFTDIKIHSRYALTVEKNGKKGLINAQYQQVVPCLYDSVDRYNDLFIVRSSGKLGVINGTGSLVIPTECDNVKGLTGQIVRITKQDSVFLLHGTRGRLTLSAQLKIDDWRGSLCLFMLDGKFGVFNLEGEDLTGAIYSAVRFIADDIVEAKLNGKIKIIHFENGKIKVGKRITILQENKGPIGTANPTFTPINSGRVRESMPWSPYLLTDHKVLNALGWYKDQKRRLWYFIDPATRDTIIKPLISQVTPLPDIPIDAVSRTVGENVRWGFFNRKTLKMEVPPQASQIDWANLIKHNLTRLRINETEWRLYSPGVSNKVVPKAGFISPSDTTYYAYCIGCTQKGYQYEEEIEDQDQHYTKEKLDMYLDGRKFNNAGGKWKMYPWGKEANQDLSFDYLSPPIIGLSVFQKGDKIGLIDADQKRYADNLTSLFLRGKLYFGAKENPGCVLISAAGDEISNTLFESVGNFSEGLAPASVDGKWGYINAQANWITPATYDQTYEFQEGIGVAVKGDTSFFLNQSGQVDFYLTNIQASPFQEGFSATRSRNGFSYINLQGEKMSWGPYQAAGAFNNGVAIVQTVSGWYLIDQQGNNLNKNPARKIIQMEDGGYDLTVDNNHLYANASGQIFSKIKFNNIFAASDQCIIGKTSKGLKIISIVENKANSTIISDIRPYHSGLAAAKATSGWWGYLNAAGDWAIEPTYASAQDFSEGLAWVKDAGDFLCLNPDGKIIAQVTAELVSEFQNGTSAIQIEANNWKFLKSDGTFTPEFSSEQKPAAGDQYVICYNKGQAVIYDLDHHLLYFAPTTEEIHHSNNIIRIRPSVAYSIYTLNGELLCNYWIQPHHKMKDRYMVMIGEESAYLDFEGNWVRPPANVNRP